VIDHLGIRVQSLEKSRRFYLTALAPLGYGALKEVGLEMGASDVGIGLGADGKPDFWISEGPGSGRLHIAFAAKDRKTVDAFYQAALSAGAKDNGPPGLRPYYHPNYYGAFVYDLDGNNLEVVCHRP
jgi:catechol 2,3-dioxygenase-like lactoylglutathione lyase family enzyme